LTVLDEAWHFSTAARGRVLYIDYQMMRTIAIAILLTWSTRYCHCQDVAKSFETASITPCKPGTLEPPGEHAGMVQFTYPGGRFHAKDTTVKFLIEWAYGILPAQHSGGPSWMDTDRFDIVAKAEGSATDHEMKLMVQTLLAERFKLKFRHESKEIQVVVITLGKGEPKLFPPKPEEIHGIKIMPQTGADQKVVSYHVVGTRFSFAQLNETFARQLGRVLVDQTGLTGDFDFAIDLTPDETSPNPLDPSLVMNAMRDQLGLTLKSQKAPVDFFMIDSIEKVEAGN
jgi:uncharacterized protein (TIGR03435 family)